MDDTLTPVVLNESKPMTMSFFDAMKKIHEGKRVTRIEWANADYGFLKDEWLSIYRDGKVFVWKVSLGDMDGNDWIIVTESN